MTNTLENQFEVTLDDQKAIVDEDLNNISRLFEVYVSHLQHEEVDENEIVSVTNTVKELRIMLRKKQQNLLIKASHVQ